MFGRNLDCVVGSSMVVNLNPQQLAAVKHSGSHALVLAGAGTGKTATIVGRVDHLLQQQGVEPRRILLVTFTRRAASEMINRLYRNNEKIASGPKVEAGTFHHFCLRTMRTMPEAFGMQEATVMDRDDQLQLVRMIRARVRRKDENFPKAARIVDIISYARNTNQPLRTYLDDNADLLEWDKNDIAVRVLQIADEYQKHKDERNYLDFDDLLHRFADKLHKHERLRKRIQGRYDHILVDEMQDTNPLQWMVLDALRDSPLLFCVGDDAQSIYAFRGADFKNVHSFTERVHGATTLKLEDNYRSTQGILDLANWLLDQSSLKYNKHLRSARDAAAHSRKNSKNQSNSDILPRLLEFEDEFSEAGWIANDLIERHECDVPWRNHMIITRTAYAARALEAALIERKVPYRFIGGTQLFQAAHVKDLLSLIRSGLSHQDDLAWMRYLTLWPGVGDVRASHVIEAIQKGSSVEEALDVLRDGWQHDESILQGVHMICTHKGPPSKIIHDAATFLHDLLEKRHDRWNQRKRDLDLLSRLAKRHRSIQAFLDIYALNPLSISDASRTEQDDAATLITVHSAKGTESPVCYLLRAEPGMYPHSRSLGDKDEEEEERRVLYVAITRARDELIMTRSLNAGGRYDGPVSAYSAYFLRDVPDNLVNKELMHSEEDWIEEVNKDENAKARPSNYDRWRELDTKGDASQKNNELASGTTRTLKPRDPDTEEGGTKDEDDGRGTYYRNLLDLTVWTLGIAGLLWWLLHPIAAIVVVIAAIALSRE